MLVLKKPRRAFRAFIGAEDGNPSIEFAFVAPVMALMLFGMVEFSRYSYTQSALSFAAEEATRAAVVQGGSITNAEIVTIVESNLLFLDAGLSTVCVLSPVDATTQTSTVSITIDYDYDPIFPAVFGNITISGSSEGFISFTPVDEFNDASGDCVT